MSASLLSNENLHVSYPGKLHSSAAKYRVQPQPKLIATRAADPDRSAPTRRLYTLYDASCL
jgi:hypothetical protein